MPSRISAPEAARQTVAEGLRRAHKTGFSQAQTTRLIGDYVKVGRICGPDICHVLKREFEVYGKSEFERRHHLRIHHGNHVQQSFSSGSAWRSDRLLTHAQPHMHLSRQKSRPTG